MGGALVVPPAARVPRYARDDKGAVCQYIDDMPDRDLVTGVFQLANLLTRRLGPILETARITPQQWSVLLALTEPMTLAMLARRLMVSKQNMTGMVARLEQLGLIDRSGDPNDLRSSRVQLTRRGRGLLEKTRPVYDAWVRQIGGGVAERDRATMERVIGELIEKLSAE